MRGLTEDEASEHASRVAEQGFSVIEGAIPEDFCAEILAELDRLGRVRPGGDMRPQPFSGFVTRRWFDLLNDADVWQRVATHPWLLPVIEQVLGEGFLLSTMGSAVIGPGEKAQPLHVDDGVYAFPRPHPNLVCNTMWALTDFTATNGATRIVPGSNNWADDPDDKKTYESVPVEMPAGSVAFVVGTCYHGAGANKTDSDRVALTINYCNGAMRQQENLMLGVHPARMMTFPEALQDILGFKVCRGAGHLFATDPRAELQRHYGAGNVDDPYLAVRSGFHGARLKAQKGPG